MMKGILQFFTVKMNISGSIITIIVVAIILISFFTVVWQAASAARKDPVKALRYE